MAVEAAVVAAGRQALERCQAFALATDDRNRKGGSWLLPTGVSASMIRESRLDSAQADWNSKPHSRRNRGEGSRRCPEEWELMAPYEMLPPTQANSGQHTAECLKKRRRTRQRQSDPSSGCRKGRSPPRRSSSRCGR